MAINTLQAKKISMRNRTLLFVIFCFFTLKFVNSQVIRHPEIPNGNCYNCNSSQDWNDIADKNLLKLSPFNKILHLSFKRKNDVTHYGTTSFVSKDLLLTARHCVDNQENLEYIELNLPSFGNKWVKLNKNDYKIYYYTERFNKDEYDIALIRIINKPKLKLLYYGHFEIAENVKNIMSKHDVNISGFPFKKFAINSTAPDTLVDRKLSSDLVEYNSSNTMIGLPICTCNGDSGGPIWIRSANNYFIVGVYHGSKSKEQGFINPNLNIGVYIGDKVAEWIKNVKATSL